MKTERNFFTSVPERWSRDRFSCHIHPRYLFPTHKGSLLGAHPKIAEERPPLFELGVVYVLQDSTTSN